MIRDVGDWIAVSRSIGWTHAPIPARRHFARTVPRPTATCWLDRLSARGAGLAQATLASAPIRNQGCRGTPPKRDIGRRLRTTWIRLDRNRTMLLLVSRLHEDHLER